MDESSDLAACAFSPHLSRDLFMTDDPIEKQLIVAQKGPWDSRTEGIKCMEVAAFTEISRGFLCLDVSDVHKHSYQDFRAVTRSGDVVIYTNVVQMCKCNQFFLCIHTTPPAHESVNHR